MRLVCIVPVHVLLSWTRRGEERACYEETGLGHGQVVTLEAVRTLWSEMLERNVRKSELAEQMVAIQIRAEPAGGGDWIQSLDLRACALSQCSAMNAVVICDRIVCRSSGPISKASITLPRWLGVLVLEQAMSCIKYGRLATRAEVRPSVYQSRCRYGPVKGLM
jgi:hypothetical protein